jgi:hypothetical protein
LQESKIEVNIWTAEDISHGNNQTVDNYSSLNKKWKYRAVFHTFLDVIGQKERLILYSGNPSFDSQFHEPVDIKIGTNSFFLDTLLATNVVN